MTLFRRQYTVFLPKSQQIVYLFARILFNQLFAGGVSDVTEATL